MRSCLQGLPPNLLVTSPQLAQYTPGGRIPVASNGGIITQHYHCVKTLSRGGGRDTR